MKKEFKNTAIEVVRLKKMDIISTSYCPGDSSCSSNSFICSGDTWCSGTDNDM